MEIFRQFLAFPMYGAAVWLLWVVSQQAGAQGVLAAATGFLLIGFAAWILGITRDRTRKFRALGLAGGGMAIVLAAAQLPGLGLVSEPNETAVRDSEAFTPARLASLRAEGRPVFVNLTAAWCVTCLVNERVAIGRESVRRGFAEHGVVYLKGDWTRQDPAITAFLRDLGRDGVPLYLYYGPKSVKPRILPQLLTEAMVLEAIGTRL